MSENNELARPEGPGSHEPSPEGLGPSGFDPSRGCEHDFAAWRDFEDSNGGELFCTRCGLGAMAHTLSLDWD